MNENLKGFLDSCTGDSDINCWVILYEGKIMKFISGKGSWTTIGSAKNAFHNGVKEFTRRRVFDETGFYGMKPHEVLNYCLENNLVEFVNLTQDKLHQICSND